MHVAGNERAKTERLGKRKTEPHARWRAEEVGGDWRELHVQVALATRSPSCPTRRQSGDSLCVTLTPDGLKKKSDWLEAKKKGFDWLRTKRPRAEDAQKKRPTKQTTGCDSTKMRLDSPLKSGVADWLSVRRAEKPGHQKKMKLMKQARSLGSTTTWWESRWRNEVVGDRLLLMLRTAMGERRLRSRQETWKRGGVNWRTAGGGEWV